MRKPLFAAPLACMIAALAAGPGRAQTGAQTVAQTGAADPSASAIAQPQAAAAQSDAIDQQIAAFVQDPAPPPAPAKAASSAAAASPPRQIHGEAGVGFGSSGYRSAYVAADIPIGRTSDLAVAVGESDIHPKGYGALRSRSLALSLYIGGGGGGAPVNCASPTAPMDGRYLEPVWAMRLRGEALARDQARCAAPEENSDFGASDVWGPGE